MNSVPPNVTGRRAITHEPSYTIDEFCLVERMTPPTYYKLKALGLGPREMRSGTLVRISHQARLDWQRARENPKGEEAVAVHETAQAMRARAHAAVKAAVVSPRHVARRRRRTGAPDAV
jgi:hypothetical protein